MRPEGDAPIGPRLEEIERATNALAHRIIKTPVVSLSSDRVSAALPEGATVTMKLELFQQVGSFKARGALLSVDRLEVTERKSGVVAVSAGNHALAVSWAAAKEGVSTKVVMPKTADPIRVQGCEALGAKVVLVEDIHTAFVEMDRIKEHEGRVAIHPFEGEMMTLGAATCGLEFILQAPDLDAIVVPVGGGGLLSGIASAVKQVSPDCTVYGVEPVGAAVLARSLEAGKPTTLDHVNTIADSLGSPVSLPYSFSVAQANVDEMVRVDDNEMLTSMVLLYDALKLASEPACAAATAAVCGPLRSRLAGQRVGLVACGSNIAEQRMADLIVEGRSIFAARKS
ncbi:threonine/serine dehydratase [uncultured Roseobacter sp.]|uniref:threonine/serine dehydratase n=1 Tax=uncultured Roseobacter sp. TaxID=114847 RepID=UPI002606F3AE|nr:threonine/serine dehydratase [uncultured Roseobacter sp.]